MNNLLIVIDMQNDFITGVFGNKETQEIVPKIADLIKNWDGNVVCTLDTHDEDFYIETIEGKTLPIHAEDGTNGWKLEPTIAAACDGHGDVHYVHKHNFMYTDWYRWIRHYCLTHQVDEITIVGTKTDICVIGNALALRCNLPKMPIKVIANYCAGTAPENHEAALKVMKNCCIEIVE